MMTQGWMCICLKTRQQKHWVTWRTTQPYMHCPLLLKCRQCGLHDFQLGWFSKEDFWKKKRLRNRVRNSISNGNDLQSTLRSNSLHSTSKWETAVCLSLFLFLKHKHIQSQSKSFCFISRFIQLPAGCRTSL